MYHTTGRSKNRRSRTSMIPHIGGGDGAGVKIKKKAQIQSIQKKPKIFLYIGLSFKKINLSNHGI